MLTMDQVQIGRKSDLLGLVLFGTRGTIFRKKVMFSFTDTKNNLAEEGGYQHVKEEVSLRMADLDFLRTIDKIRPGMNDADCRTLC